MKTKILLNLILILLVGTLLLPNQSSSAAPPAKHSKKSAKPRLASKAKLQQKTPKVPARVVHPIPASVIPPTVPIPAVPAAKQDEPTLEETIAFIQDMVTRFGNVYSSEGNDTYQVSIQDQILNVQQNSNFTHMKSEIYTSTVAMKSLDPNVTHRQYGNVQYGTVGADYILILTTDSENLVKEATDGKVYRVASDITICFQDHPDIAERVAKAFSHAIKLCGGQPSGKKPGDPF